jgi:hypothetical protein
MDQTVEFGKVEVFPDPQIKKNVLVVVEASK